MLLVALVLLGAAPELEAEAKRRTDALISQGFNLTHGWTLDARPEKTTARFEFFVPDDGEEHSFSSWAETQEGGFDFRILGPDGKVRGAWSGRKGDTTITFVAARGKYVAELDRAPGTSGRGLFAVKGAVVTGCPLDPQAEHPASPAKGFHWPYLLYVPKELKRSRLLVAPNNTGFQTNDVELLRSAGSCELRRQSRLADRLGTPLLVPLFPRPKTKEGEDSLYLHALTRSSLESKIEVYRRVDLQLLAMIDDARTVLKNVPPEVLLWGFSASGSFVSRFTVLHPERVKAVAVGSPGGWPIAPAAKLRVDTLPYPVGTADLEALVGLEVDEAALRRVAWLFFLGAQDTNDSVPFRDSFSAADEALVRRFGKTPVSRWKEAGAIYKRAGLDAKFVLYPGVGHQVSPEMDRDIAAFFEKY